MTSVERVERVLARYRDGIYLVKELFLLIARNTDIEDIKDVVAIVPEDLRSQFEQWVREYPLSGGVHIGSSTVHPPRKEVIVALKQFVGETGPDTANENGL